ncbi:MAG: hypothetical protein AAGF12_28110, partial [Myxococcota bacterium]
MDGMEPASADDQSSGRPGPHPQGIPRVLALFVALGIGGLVPYLAAVVVPEATLVSLGVDDDLERLTPYSPGDPIPFSRFLDFR